MLVIDSPQNCSAQAACLKSAGIETVIRYYAREFQKSLPEKQLSFSEGATLCSSGLQLAVFINIISAVRKSSRLRQVNEMVDTPEIMRLNR